MAEYIERMKEEFRGLLPDAVAALRHTLQVQKDGRIALEILRDVGVAPRKGEEPQLPATTAEDGYSRQAVMIANVLLEGREHMGLDLGPEIEGALAKDEQESHPPTVQRISSHCAQGASLGQTDAAKKVLKMRGAAQGVPFGLSIQEHHMNVAFLMRFFEPLQRLL